MAYPEKPAAMPFPRPPETSPSLPNSLLLLMAVACGVFVANIYYNQPILALLGEAFPNTPVSVALIPSATQLGFAAGLFLLVPLGDRFNRRILVLWQGGALCVALVALAVAPDARSAAALSILVGLAGSVVQQIVPFAAELATPNRRGQTIGVVMSGVLCGILLGRALGGFIGEHWGWRAVFGLGAILSSSAWLLLMVRLPNSRPQTQQTYFKLMQSLMDLWREEPLLRRAAYSQAALFGSFIGLWTILALYLNNRFGWGAETAGLMGVVGAVGILIAPLAGRIADRHGPYVMIALGALIMCLSYMVLGLWGSVLGLIIGVILLDLGEQAALISNQHVVYALRPEARSRLNTLFMTTMFIGGAAGSWSATQAWEQGGWPLACIFGGAAPLIALALQLKRRR